MISFTLSHHLLIQLQWVVSASNYSVLLHQVIVGHLPLRHQNITPQTYDIIIVADDRLEDIQVDGEDHRGILLEVVPLLQQLILYCQEQLTPGIDRHIIQTFLQRII
jgi:hypothetical protein